MDMTQLPNGLIVPASEVSDRPVLQCHLCEELFYDAEQLARHCVKCANANEERVAEINEREQMREFYEPFDKGLEDWLDRDDTRQQVMDGRKKM